MIKYIFGGILAGLIGLYFGYLYGLAFFTILYFLVLCFLKLIEIEKKVNQLLNKSDTNQTCIPKE